MLIGAIAAIAASLIGWLSYAQARQVQMETFRAELRGEARIVGVQVREMLGDMLEDEQIIAASSAITEYSNGAGGNFGLSEGLRRRIESTFATVLKVHPNYTQIRILQNNAQGKELVRVDKSKGEIIVIPAEQMQDKGKEPYFRLIRNLKSGQTAFSDVTLNRENGQIAIPHVPTIRAFLPIVDQTGNVFAVIAINANIEGKLSDLFSALPPRHEIALVDHFGNYLLAGPNVQTLTWVMKSQSGQVPGNLGWIQEAKLHKTMRYDGQFLEYVGAGLHGTSAGFDFGIIAHAPVDSASAHAYALPASKITLAASAILICLILAFLYIKQITRPLANMTREIRLRAQKGHQLNLPLQAQDEIGELARAFDEITRSIWQEEAKLSAIIENVNDAMIVIQASGIIDRVNPACEAIFGYSETDLLGKNVAKLMPKKVGKGHDKYIANYMKTGQQKIIGIGREVECRRKNGETFPADLSISEFEYRGNQYFCGIIRDITERHNMERMRDEFVSTVNHELRTPLSSIYGAICILKEKSADRLDAQGKRLLEVTMDACNRLARLVDDILDLEKIASGQMDFDPARYDLIELVHEIVSNHEGLAIQHDVTLQVHDDCAGPVKVFVDPNRLSQALANLLSNACKYSPAGECVSTSVTCRSNGMVRVSVKDNGPGIPESFQPRVFDKFAQADGSTTRKSGSSGLGLAITKMLVEGMSGLVSFETSANSGTCFHIDLPLMEFEEEAA